RHGRKSNAHSSARRELAANAHVAKRGRRKQEPPPVQGTHDAEAGGSRTRARSRLGQAQVRVPDAEDDYDAAQYLNDDAEYAKDEPEVPQQPPQQPPMQQNVEEVGYGGGPSDL
ncbi:hypothetical protein A2U01_0057380, partial [Trifolium medium]|nr:hypothetical protein [Trifolium medium]